MIHIQNLFSKNETTGKLLNASIEYFRFEEDFIEDNIRCIPMIVRFKLDACGIKLTLHEWCLFSAGERLELATRSCLTKQEIIAYRRLLMILVKMYTGKEPSEIAVDKHPGWTNSETLPAGLLERMDKEEIQITIDQWNSLLPLQRFTLLKLCKPGHENRNFIPAMKEFKLI